MRNHNKRPFFINLACRHHSTFPPKYSQTQLDSAPCTRPFPGALTLLRAVGLSLLQRLNQQVLV